MTDVPFLPQRDSPTVAGLVPAILGGDRSWFPGPARASRGPTVLMVLDGLGWTQLEAFRHLTPTLASMAGAPISTVAPSTTATALTSITTGLCPGDHGVVGYRVYLHGEVLNVLRWATAKGDARRSIPPEQVQHRPAFLGHHPVVVTRSEFAGSGFTLAHLAGGQLIGWRLPSGLPVEVAAAIRRGEPFVYSYYDGIDKVAHEYGLGAHYEAELVFADRLVADVIAAVPAGTEVIVTADHGQVDVGERIVSPAAGVLELTRAQSGEGRFRWLHARWGREADLLAATREAHGHHAWVAPLEQVADEHWFGPRLAPAAAARLGDVALVAREPISFEDRADTGSIRLIARHGSLTRDEMLVPLLVAAS